MENKINIAEILKDCPQGMELYSPIFGKVYLDKVRRYLAIIVTTDRKQGDSKEEFLYDGRYGMNGECMLFPSKGKTTWEGFVPPCQFKDGDIIFKNSFVVIVSDIKSNGIICYHCWYDTKYKKCKIEENFGIGSINDGDEVRLATEEEKQLLFDAIKANGYKWNAETKTLEKLPKFKVGNKIKYKDTILTIIDVQTNNYIVEDEPDNFGILMFSQQDKWELINEPKFKFKFKVDDKVKLKGGDEFGIITQVSDCFYTIKCKNNTHCWPIQKQDDWELINEPKFKVGDTIKGLDIVNPIKITGVTPKMYTFRDGSFQYVEIIDKNYELVSRKFDISSLKPFDKVLVRDTKEQVWVADLFSHTVNRPLGGYTFACVGHYPNQCIPYKDNEHLLGTNNEPDSFYKIWE